MNISNVSSFSACALKLIALLWVSGSLEAQSILPLEQELRLAEYNLRWTPPTDTPYRLSKRKKINYQAVDFSLELRKQRTQIRYLIEPTNTDQEQDMVPHIRATTMAMHLASNEEDSYLSVHQVEPTIVDSVYQADWVQTYFFKPKPIFSLAKHCQMTAIYREGVALAYIFLLFDEAPNSLPVYAESLRFRARELLD